MKKLAATLLTALLLVFGFTACDNGNNGGNGNENDTNVNETQTSDDETETNGNETEQTIEVTEITLSKQQLTLKEGSEETLTATVTPDNADKTVIWTSSDDKIAKVDNGKVTAVSAGTATVTAKAGEKTATCTVTVEQAKVEFTGVWKLNKFVILGNSYIIGVDDEKFKEDLELDGDVDVSESYKLVLNADGTGIYTEEWEPVPCRWKQNDNGVELEFDNGSHLTFSYSDGILGCEYEEAEAYFKK